MNILSATLFAFLAASAGGTFYTEEKIPGATLKISVLQPIDDEKAAEIVDWLESTATDINRVYGRFPNRTANIIVIPSERRAWGSNDAVIFGRVTRSNGATIELFVNADRPIHEFYSDWTATHEFSHLMLPLLRREHRWISEGFATYYQNVLMSRAGRYTPERAWEKLVAGFERGRRSVPTLSPNEATAGRVRQSTMKIYWSGAALALMADVELRQRSGGTESLDTLLGELQRCCLPARRTWSGPELFRKLDSMTDKPVFMPLYRRYANRAGFPELTPVLTELGVNVVNGDQVSLSSDAAAIDVRRSLMDEPPGNLRAR